ncbi:MAG TPA: class I SAM-dependent methyltransferase [Terracidiphilus sp.]|nr:class I SAM-dependent methyltransferase [Terracidiphilus sp.]
MQTLTNFLVTSNPPLLDYKSTLDLVNDRLQEGRIEQPLDLLFEDLRERREEDPKNWPGYARSCLGHPLRSLLHQDPFTYRAFAKPRGYAGDAVMMDYIYGLGEASPAARDASPLGRAIFQYMGARPSAKAVRYRRRLLAELVDRVAGRGGSSVLAIAAGHLREVELSTAVRNGKLQEYVAFDQDEASLAVVSRDCAHLGVRTMPGSVRQILAGKAKLGQYDLVYAAGLYDYLSDPAAVALTRRMFEMTRPGGSMLIPNFLVGARDTGYMESFMDWRLIYRSHTDMQALANALPRGEMADCRIFDDPDDTITFLLVSKAR